MFVDIYLRGMRDRSVRNGTESARKIQLTDWSTSGNLSNRSSGVQISRDIYTRFGRYLYSTGCSSIIIQVNIWKAFDLNCGERYEDIMSSCVMTHVLSVTLFPCRAGVKGMMVLLPLLGLTWVFGIMAINKDTIAFQYLFAILNSLQVTEYLQYLTSFWLQPWRLIAN